MPYVVTFEDYTPPARFDELGWNAAIIQEAATRAGTYTTIETIPLVPLDVDPRDPVERTLTTTQAALQVGWYVLVWQDADGNTAPTAPTFNSPYRPTPDDVAAVLPARTTARGGSQGTFTATTEPSADRVDDLIEDAAADVTARIGADIPGSAYATVSRLIALGAALSIEIGARDFNQARYDRLKTMYDDRMQVLAGDPPPDGVIVDPPVVGPGTIGPVSPLGLYPRHPSWLIP